MAKRTQKPAPQRDPSQNAQLLAAQKLAREGELSAAADALEIAAKKGAAEERARQLSLAARFVQFLEPDRAQELLGKAESAAPKSAIPWIAKAQIADAAHDKTGAAKAAALRALELGPKGAQRIELGLLLARIGEDERGMAESKAGYAELGSPIAQATSLLRIALQAADWATADALTPRLLKAHREGRTVAVGETPRTHLLWCADEPINLAVQRAFAERNFPAMPPLGVKARPSQGRKLRIGYLSSDYRDHATSWLFRGLLRNHNRERFDLTAYCTGWDDGSVMRREMFAHFDRVRLFSGVNDKVAAQMVVDDEIDILVDLNGLTEGTRMGILAWRPAPVQVAYLGFPGSSGGRFIDYVVADPHVVPEEKGAAYPEKLIRIQRTYQINDYAERPLPPKPSRQAVGLPPKAVVAGMFNNINKVGSQVWETWMQILNVVPGVLLWVLDPGPAARKNLVKAATASGLDPKRLLFAPKLTQESHVARMQHCDIMLDPWPYGGHTSTADAIYSGVPVVAMEGTNFASRVSSSLLHAAGLRELVNADREAYVRTAVSLLTQPHAVAYSKQFIRESSIKNDVFNARSKTAQFEAAYEEVHARAVKGQPARNVTIRLRPPEGAPEATGTARTPAIAVPAAVASRPKGTAAATRGKAPELVLVCGPWSSGTSAVAGVLANLGLEGLPPYFMTRDERTKNSYESNAFRDAVMAVASEEQVGLTVAPVEALARMRAFRAALLAGELGANPLAGGRTFFLKYPLSAALIPQICAAFNTRLVYVLRPVREIEATRERRGWAAHQGAAGAQRVYSYMFGAMVEHRIPTMMVRYPELVERPVEITRDLARFAGMDVSAQAIEKAAAFIRKGGT
jgi:predicted O-linked N-acetylglucosamine transferase (SPINDLY family)